MSRQAHLIGRWWLPLALLFCLLPVMATGDTHPPFGASQDTPLPQHDDGTGPGIAGGNSPSQTPGANGAGSLADIHDIKPIIVPKGPPWAAIWIGGAALLILILLLLGRYLWKKRRKGGAIPTLTPELPPEENARLALDALAAERFVDGRRFYFRLSEILRRYLFERYGIGAPEMTPEELQPLVARLKLPDGQLGVLNRFWSHSEPVKFAGRPAREADMAADLDGIGRFVEVTTAALNPPLTSDTPQEPGVSIPEPTASPTEAEASPPARVPAGPPALPPVRRGD